MRIGRGHLCSNDSAPQGVLHRARDACRYTGKHLPCRGKKKDRNDYSPKALQQSCCLHCSSGISERSTLTWPATAQPPESPLTAYSTRTLSPFTPFILH